jgi:Zn-finger in Ran binding protein and others
MHLTDPERFALHAWMLEQLSAMSSCSTDPSTIAEYALSMLGGGDISVNSDIRAIAAEELSMFLGSDDATVFAGQLAEVVKSRSYMASHGSAAKEASNDQYDVASSREAQEAGDNYADEYQDVPDAGHGSHQGSSSAHAPSSSDDRERSDRYDEGEGGSRSRSRSRSRERGDTDGAGGSSYYRGGASNGGPRGDFRSGPGSSGGGGGPSSRPGEWDCPRCYGRNFPGRNVCFKCKTQRPPQASLHGGGAAGGAPSYYQQQPYQQQQRGYGGGYGGSSSGYNSSAAYGGMQGGGYPMGPRPMGQHQQESSVPRPLMPLVPRDFSATSSSSSSATASGTTSNAAKKLAAALSVKKQDGSGAQSSSDDSAGGSSAARPAPPALGGWAAVGGTLAKHDEADNGDEDGKQGATGGDASGGGGASTEPIRAAILPMSRPAAAAAPRPATLMLPVPRPMAASMSQLHLLLLLPAARNTKAEGTKRLISINITARPAAIACLRLLLLSLTIMVTGMVVIIQDPTVVEVGITTMVLPVQPRPLHQLLRLHRWSTTPPQPPRNAS